MRQKLSALLITFILVSTFVFAVQLNRNGVDFYWEYTYLTPKDYEVAKVTKNVDGDTIKVVIEDKEESIRMIGVDTPETVHPSKPVEAFGKEASAFTKAMCPVGSTVYLTYDWDPRDKYNRLLAYIWYKIGNTWVLHNLNLIANGYGNAYTAFSFKNEYMTLFRSAETYARNKQRGLWKDGETSQQTSMNQSQYDTSSNNTSHSTNISSSSGNVIISYVKAHSSAEYVEIKNIGSSSVNLSGWKLVSVEGNQSHILSGVLKPGQSLKVYSGPEAEGRIWSTNYIHNNNGDEVQLYNSSGKFVDSEKW